MLIYLLSDQEKKDFFYIAALLSIADKPLLWDGKAKQEVTFNTNKVQLSIRSGEKESALLQQWLQSSGNVIEFGFQKIVQLDLLNKLKNCPIETMDSPETRFRVISTILRTFFQDRKNNRLSGSKIVLFQLILLALADGNISNIEYQFLNEFKINCCIEDDIFKELFVCAENMHKELQKTIEIIFE